MSNAFFEHPVLNSRHANRGENARETVEDEFEKLRAGVTTGKAG